MRKQTKLVAVLSAAALLAVGASMTSFAAGWAQEDGIWVWLDSSGDRVTDTWKKSSTNYYYLNEDGEMAVDTLIEDGDDKYYVDTTGARVTNQWHSFDNEDDETIGTRDDVSTIWYYFGANGKAYKSKAKTVNGKKYIFDDNGYMISGWYEFESEWYYLGDENEGWAATGWQYLEPEESMSPTDPDKEYDDEEWFYFKPANGKAYKGKRYYIDGKYYAFDDNGVMLDKWAVGTPGAPATYQSARYTESGAQATGWVYAYPVSDPDEDGDYQYWYYLDSKGVPFNLGGKDVDGANTLVKKDNDKWATDKAFSGAAAKVIKGKTYLFNNKGEMQTGVFKVTGTVGRTGGSNLEAGIYYFTKGSGSTEGSMVTGKASVNYDGDVYNYYFQKDGRAYRWYVVDGTLYGKDGERWDAEDGNTYDVIECDKDIAVGQVITVKNGSPITMEDGDMLIVNANGKIKKSGNVKIDGTKYKVTNYKAEVVTE